MTDQEGCDFLWRVLDRSDRAVSLADAKAGGVLAFCATAGAMMAINRAAIQGLYQASSRPWTFWAVGVLIGAAVVCVLLALRPRLVRGRSGRSLIFFGDIARAGRDGAPHYLSRVQNQDLPALLDDLARQVQANSRIARAKHRLVQVAISFLILALGAAALCILPRT